MSATISFKVNLSTCQPRLTASLRPGFVRLCCELRGAPAYRLHTRIRGESWHCLVDNCEAQHIEDHTPNAFPGFEETREYRVTPVWNGEEVGHPSEIVSVTVPA